MIRKVQRSKSSIRNYFVRTLATEARLPMLITESNRYLNESLGLVRLKALFQRAREQAPNILFIRDMDFMTRHRERYPAFTSVRATTQLLLAKHILNNTTQQLCKHLTCIYLLHVDQPSMSKCRK